MFFHVRIKYNLKKKTTKNKNKKPRDQIEEILAMARIMVGSDS